MRESTDPQRAVVIGEGPLDIANIGGVASHLDLQWEDPVFVGGRERLASFARVVIFDRRGTGLSDPLDRPGTLEQQMDDLDAVLEAVGMERVALFGAAAGCTPESARYSKMTSTGSLSTSARASARSRVEVRCSSRVPSKTSSSGLSSSSMTAVRSNFEAYPASGGSMPSGSDSSRLPVGSIWELGRGPSRPADPGDSSVSKPAVPNLLAITYDAM